MKWSTNKIKIDNMKSDGVKAISDGMKILGDGGAKLGKKKLFFNPGCGFIKAGKVAIAVLVAIVQLFMLAMPVTVNAAPAGVSLSIKMDEKLVAGEFFTVEATVANNTGADIANVSFYVSTGDTLKVLGENPRGSETIKNGESHTFQAELMYTGNPDIVRINFSCTYDGGGPVTAHKNAYFANKDVTPPSTPDTTKSEPVLKIKSGIPMPVFKAGEDVALRIPIVNNSEYAAKNVRIALDTSNVNALPFTFDQVALVDSIETIEANKEDEASFNIKIKPDAKDGLYPVVLNFQYNNVYNNKYTLSETIYIRILNDETSPKLILENIYTYSNDPSPGNIMSLKLTFRNQGTLPAKDVNVKLDGLSSEGVTTYKSAVGRYINQVDGGGEGVAEYMLVISEQFTGTNISLNARVEYKDGMGNSYSDDYSFFIRVNQKEEEKKEYKKPELVVRDLNYPDDAVQAGEEFELGFTLGNEGNDKAQNVKISLSCENGILPKTASTVVFDSLEEGREKDLKFAFIADKKASTKNYLITINIDYEDIVTEEESRDGNTPGIKTEKYSLTRYAGIYVEELIEEEEEEEEEKKEEEKTVPKIIISKYSFEPEDIRAGHNFKLKLSFINTSKIKPVRNIKVTFSADEGVFIPANSSNTFFIENMGIQEIVEREVELHPKSDAAAKSHILTIVFEYEDEKGSQYSTSEKISIPVKQEQRLVVGQFNVPQSTMEGQPIPIFLEFYNMGKSVLYNLMVKFEGEGFQAENASYFAGNFDAGRGDYFEVMITPVVAGEAQGAIVFTYEDATGEKSEVREEISINVMPMASPEMPIDYEFPEKPMPGEMPGQENSWKKLLTPLNMGIAGGGLLVIVAVLIIILRRRRIRKAVMDFDE